MCVCSHPFDGFKRYHSMSLYIHISVIILTRTDKEGYFLHKQSFQSVVYDTNQGFKKTKENSLERHKQSHQSFITLFI